MTKISCFVCLCVVSEMSRVSLHLSLDPVRGPGWSSSQITICMSGKAVFNSPSLNYTKPSLTNARDFKSYSLNIYYCRYYIKLHIATLYKYST